MATYIINISKNKRKFRIIKTPEPKRKSVRYSIHINDDSSEKKSDVQYEYEEPKEISYRYSIKRLSTWVVEPINPKTLFENKYNVLISSISPFEQYAKIIEKDKLLN